MRNGTPLHGPNLFPDQPEGFREAVLDYMEALTGLGHHLTAGLALSLLYEVAEEGGAWRERRMIDVAVEGLIHSEHELGHTYFRS